MKKINFTQKTIFLALSLSCITLNAIALVFQYGFGMEPCIMCIYQRIVLAILTPIFILCAFIKQPSAIFIGAFTSLCLVGYGMKVAFEHAYNQFNSNPFASCAFRPEIYNLIPLDKFIPSIFEVRGACDQINWVFLNMTMPMWLFVSYSIMLCIIAFGAHTAIKFSKKKRA